MKLRKIAAVALAFTLVCGAVPLNCAVVNDTAVYAEEEAEYTEGTYGVLTYKNYGDYIEITDCDTSAAEVEIPSEIDGVAVTSIGESAFIDCCNLIEVIIPNGVDTIGNTAFGNCTSLTEIMLPGSVNNIGLAPFLFCEKLIDVKVDSNNTVFSSIDGVLFSKDNSELFLYPNGRTGTYSVPENVTSIGKSAFEYCLGLEKIVLCEGLTSISNFAFAGCENLKSVDFPSSVTYIGQLAFGNCFGLEEIIFPEKGDMFLDQGAFVACKSLVDVTLNRSVTKIEDCAFANCKSLENITIYNPDCVIIERNYSGSTIANESSMYSGTITGYEGSTAQTYAEKYSRTFVSLGEAPTDVASGICGENLTWVLDNNWVLTISGEGGMTDWDTSDSPWNDYVDKIQYVIIEDGVTSIGYLAFKNCVALETITIPDSVLSIGQGAFAYCQSLKSIIIPDSVTFISDSAFHYCTALSSIVISDNITSIYRNTFEGCHSLTSITIPYNVTSVGYYAFAYCGALTSITIENPKCEIDYHPMTFDDGAVIYGYSGSTAQAYAEKYGRTFVALDDAPSETVYGDANCDGDVLVNDAVLVMAYATNSEECTISEQGLLNADVYQSGDGVAVTDAAAIQKYLTKLIASLPES